jgi:hypothetical protein
MRSFPSNLLIIMMGLLFVLVITSGCGGEKSTTTPPKISLPVFSSNSTTVTVTKTYKPDDLKEFYSSLEFITLDYPIPANYKTYTDPNGLFEISYPGNWEITKNPYLDMINASNSVHQFYDHQARLSRDSIWMFGVSTNNTSNADIGVIFVNNTNIVFTSPTTESSGFNYKMEINGRDAVLSHSTGFEHLDIDHPNYATLSLIVPDERYSWGLLCRSGLWTYEEWENDFMTVAGNFRLFR